MALAAISGRKLSSMVLTKRGYSEGAGRDGVACGPRVDSDTMAGSDGALGARQGWPSRAECASQTQPDARRPMDKW